jgi:hypothetical protein
MTFSGHRAIRLAHIGTAVGREEKKSILILWNPLKSPDSEKLMKIKERK